MNWKLKCCYSPFDATIYYGPRAGPENKLWFSIYGPGRAVSCLLRAGRAAKVLARAISTTSLLPQVFLTSHAVLYCVKRSCISVASLNYSLRHIGHTHNLTLQWMFETCGSRSIAADSLLLLFTQYKKQRVLALSAFTVSLHHLPKMFEVNSHMRKNALFIVTWSESLKIRCHVIVTQLRETVEQCARKFRKVSLQAKEWTWVNCKLITAPHQNSEAGFCAVWLPYR